MIHPRKEKSKRIPHPRREKELTVRSNRRNIVVIAGEANRSQHDFLDSPSWNPRDALPRASSSASPARRSRRRTPTTRPVFGDNIDTYAIKQTVDDLGW